MATTVKTKKPAAPRVKIDLKRELKELYRPSAKKAALVDVPEMKYLMINGVGSPENNRDFQEAIEALYGVAYTLKFMLKKKEAGVDHTVMPLEGLWWMAGGKKFDMRKKKDWRWTLMIAQPPHVKESDVRRAMQELKEKKSPLALARVRFKDFDEGRAVQIMHIGPYSEEGPTIEKLHQYAKEHGLKPKGKHHEIYMGDPRRSAPEKLKTILRQPVR